jgi:hypothetical protein
LAKVFEKDAECFKTYGKISKKKKKWVRNIQPKNSVVVYLNEYCSDRFRSGRNRLWGPICIQNQVTVFYFSPAPPLLAGVTLI